MAFNFAGILDKVQVLAPQVKKLILLAKKKGQSEPAAPAAPAALVAPEPERQGSTSHAKTFILPALALVGVVLLLRKGRSA